ncbi:MAG: right-handed parallel beta-helix repeat-containing protein [Acidimicrobiales bacterium]
MWLGPMLAVGVAVAGALIVAALAGWPKPAAAKVTIEPAGPNGSDALVVRSGTVDDLDTLRGAAVRLRRLSALQLVGPGTWLLSMPVVIETGGRLDIEGVELRLSSGRQTMAPIEARGGQVRVLDSVVTSWDEALGDVDTDLSDGRAYMLATEGAWMDLVASKVRMLGYDADDRTGLSWVRGASGAMNGSEVVGGQSDAHLGGSALVRIRNSVLERALGDGLAARAECGQLVIENNVFRANGRHGALLAGGCADAVLRANKSYSNGADGILVSEASSRVAVVGNELHDNSGAGVAVRSSDGVTVIRNQVWANGTGVSLVEGPRDVVLADNRFSSNRTDGIFVGLGSSRSRMTGNRLDHNGRAGVWVEEGDVAIGPGNTLTGNDFGIWIEPRASPVRVERNTIVANLDDGISLGRTTDLVIEGNAISRNVAAFSVPSPGGSASFLGLNTLAQNRRDERVRPPTGPAPPAVAPAPSGSVGPNDSESSPEA